MRNKNLPFGKGEFFQLVTGSVSGSKTMNDTSPDNDFLIAGIGASAGGLDALQRLLASLPRDFGFALVFIQHLSGRHKDILQELLGNRYPSLVIQQISDGLKIQPGRLYLAPPGKEVRAENGFFLTTAHPEGLIHLPIDEFLASLAGDAGDRAVAVILSGAGTDGARGCSAVRSAGGTVLVQAPQTAEFDSMPDAAIATGQADAVLVPEDIAAELLKLQGLDREAALREQPVSAQEYADFFRILQEKTGSRFNYYKKSVVSRRIRRRMHLHGFVRVRDYLDLVAGSDPEAAHLASDLMIGVTSFFRDRVAWKALNIEVIRTIVSEHSTLPVRVWTAASSTGEEAYSIAMMLLHELAKSGKKREVQVFATDVNDRVLEHAREGRYPAGIAKEIPEEYVLNHFTPADGGNILVVNKAVRESVVFARQDILADPPFSKLDLIICRNLLIYLEPEAQEKSIGIFHYALRDGGFLFLGNAETVGRRSSLFKSIGHKQCRIYRKLEAKTTSRLHLMVSAAAGRAASAKAAETALRTPTTTEKIQEKLLEEYGPASVAIDQHYEIIYHNGPTNRYLCQPRGVPTQNLLELVPENLKSRLRGALYRAGHEGKTIVVRAGTAGNDNKKRIVTLRISRIADNLTLVVFQEQSTSTQKEPVEQIETGVAEETAIHQLESELKATRADLQTHIEQLKSMNEELQSSNEELQAANEELETSREELQSLNEELVTVNAQLQSKIEEQDVLNNDLNNFIASTNLPTLFLDTEFRVKRFAPAMLKLVKLLPSDLGRPIADLSLDNLGPDLLSDSRAVLEALAPGRRELDIEGVSYIRMIQPYRTADNRIEGVVVTFNDVTELKQAEEGLRRSEELFRLAADTIPAALAIYDAERRYKYVNAAGLQRVGRTLDALLGRRIDEMYDEESRRPFWPALMTAYRTGTPQTVEVSMNWPTGAYELVISFIPMLKDGRVYQVLNFTSDITERRKAEEAMGRLAAIVESADDAIISEDLNGVIQTWNRGAEKIFGYAANEAIGKPISLMVPPGHADEVPAILERIKRGESIGNFETLRMRKDGTFIPVSLTFSAVRDANGKIIGASKIAHDITERKKAEETLSASEEKYRSLFENMTEEVHFWRIVRGADGEIKTWRLVDANPPTLKTWGRTSIDEIRGKSTDEIFGPGATEHYMPIIQKIISEGAPYSFEDYFPHLDKFFRFTSVPFGEYFITTGADITNIKKAEQELRRSREDLDRAQAVGQIGWWRLDTLRNVLMWSPENHRIFGVPEGTPMSYEFFLSIVHPDDRRYVDTQWQAGLRGDPYDIEHRIIAEGQVKWVREKAYLEFDQGGRLLGGFGITQDITARKTAEESLRRSEGRWNAAIENFAEGAIIATEDEQVIYWNPAAREMHGFTRPDEGIEPLEKTPVTFQLWTPDASHLLELDEWPMRRIKRGEAVRNLELRIRRPDQGWEKFFSYSGTMVDTAGGERLIFLTCYDLTDLRRAEQSLRESERRLVGVLESMPDAFVSFDAGMRYTYVNANAERLQAARREELLGKDVRTLYPDAESKKTISEYERVIREQKPVTSTSYHAGFDRWVEIQAFPTPDGVSVFYKDVSSHVKAEQALRDSEGRFRLALRNAPISIAAQDLNLRYIWAFNQRTARPEQIIGHTDDEIFMPEEAARVTAIKRRVIEENIEQREQMWFQRPDGRIFLDILWEPIRDSSGKVAGVASATIDLTQIKKAEEALKTAHDELARRSSELESANRELEAFSYAVSHDLKAPLRSIEGFSSALFEDYAARLDDTGKDYLNRVRAATHRMNQLIEAMLNMGRLTRGDLRDQTVDLTALTRSIAHDLQKQDPGRAVEFVIAEGAKTKGDNAMLRAVLENLLQNAWKFTSRCEKANIEFGVLKPEARNAKLETSSPLIYFIKDNGAGFDMRHADKLFQPFKRLHTDSEFPGLGIGLATANRIILRHNGRLWAESKPGRGATFFFTIG